MQKFASIPAQETNCSTRLIHSLEQTRDIESLAAKINARLACSQDGVKFHRGYSKLAVNSRIECKCVDHHYLLRSLAKVANLRKALPLTRLFPKLFYEHFLGFVRPHV